MKKKATNYVHRERLRWGLSQPEVARLLGLRSRTSIAHLEASGRRPSNRALIAGEIAFGLSPPHLYPGLYDEIEESVVSAAYEMHQELEAQKGKAVELKRELLQAIISRGSRRNFQKNNGT